MSASGCPNSFRRTHSSGQGASQSPFAWIWGTPYKWKLLTLINSTPQEEGKTLCRNVYNIALLLTFLIQNRHNYICIKRKHGIFNNKCNNLKPYISALSKHLVLLDLQRITFIYLTISSSIVSKQAGLAVVRKTFISEGPCFECCFEYRLSWMRCLMPLSVPPGKGQGITSIRPRSISSSKSSFKIGKIIRFILLCRPREVCYDHTIENCYPEYK
jgi:hypothetical protein